MISVPEPRLNTSPAIESLPSTVQVEPAPVTVTVPLATASLRPRNALELETLPLSEISNVPWP